jgi:hypothetical protein
MLGVAEIVKHADPEISLYRQVGEKDDFRLEMRFRQHGCPPQ